MTLRKYCLSLWIISSAEIFAFYKQTIWPIVVEMNDVYTLSSVSFQREHIGCIECAVTASSMIRWSFSCSNVNQTCLIHDDCLEKSTLRPGTFTDSIGWRHFCRRTYRFRSNEDWQDVGLPLSQKMSLRFDVKASNDAYLGLSTGNSTTFPGYWIVLGGWNNLQSCLRLGFAPSSCYDLHNASSLKATEYVKFWVQWDSGNVRVGMSEELGNGRILQYAFSNDYAISNILAAGYADWIFYP